MERARVELGADAMIIASNKTSGESQRLGMYEVVFGIPDEPAAPAPTPATPTEGLERLRNRMEDMRKSVSKKREQASAARSPLAARVTAMLSITGFPADLAHEIGNAVQARARGGAKADDKKDLLAALRSELNSRIRVAARLGSNNQARSAVAFVGPPGVGKSTTIAKLAVTFGLAAGRPVRLISTDTWRLGGSGLLRGYSEAMGVRFDAPSNLDLLERCMAPAAENELLLIDTAGAGPAEVAKSAPLAALLSKRADIEVHMVLPAYASFADLTSMAQRFKPFLPSKLIFTGVDNAVNLAPMVAHAMVTEAAVSFLGVGQQVPEDLESASANALTGRLLPSLANAVVPAA